MGHGLHYPHPWIWIWSFLDMVMSLLIRCSCIPFYFYFSITSSTLLIHHYAPPLMWLHATWCDHMGSHPLTTLAFIHFIGPASLIWWTGVLQFTCFISILSSPTCALLQPNQSWILMPHGQALTIASLQMSLILAFLFAICIKLAHIYLLTHNCLYEFPPEFRLSTYTSPHITFALHHFASHHTASQSHHLYLLHHTWRQSLTPRLHPQSQYDLYLDLWLHQC